MINLSTPAGQEIYDIRKQLQEKFDVTNGHKHTGAAGDAPKLLSSAVKFRGALIHSSTAQSVGAGAAITLSWDTKEYDTNGFWGLTNPTRITIPTGVSRVRLTANLYWSGAIGLVEGWMAKNGTYFVGIPTQQASSATSSYMDTNFSSSVIAVVAGDYFEVKARNTTSSNSSIQSDYTWFSIEVIE